MMPHDWAEQLKVHRDQTKILIENNQHYTTREMADILRASKSIKKELLPFVTVWVELERIMLSEISQVVRDKYHMISPIGRT